MRDLRCEYLEDPLGLDVDRPRLSWLLETAGGRRDVRQSAYRILVADDPAELVEGGQLRWDSGWVTSAATAHVPYEGPPLGSRERVHWTVASRGDDGGESAFAPPAWWEAGLRSPDDWRASWIAAPTLEVPFLRTTFELERPIVRARLHVTALGLYRVWCNGTRVGDTWFTPGWTDYHQRVQVQTYDVTDLVRTGGNAVGAVLADGWYAGYVGFQGARELYGTHPELLAQLEVEHPDGTVTTVVTDGSWRARTGPLRATDMLMGERYDAREALGDWTQPGHDEDGWDPVAIGTGTSGQLVGPRAPGVEVLEERRPLTVSPRPGGRVVLDFGQNLAGWVRLTVQGPAGRLLRLRFAEVLGPDGELHTANLRDARATDEYVLSGDGTETWEPWFTFHGFRYVEVTGWPGELTPDDVVAVACGTRLRETGTFTCSSALLNQLQSNIQWSQRTNFLEVPTDCPQRDERLGWMGDAQVFAATACFNQDVAPFLTKWLQDIVDAQSDSGGFPNVAPRVVDVSDGMPGWGDAGVIVPWRMWEWYADRRLLEQLLPACIRWVDHVEAGSTDGRWLDRRGYDVGDWLSLEAETPKDLIATAYHAHSAELVRRMAQLLGEPAEAERVGRIADRARAAFARWYVDDDGRVAGSTQTGYALALRFGLVPEHLRAAAAGHLVADVEARGGHPSVGFLGVEHLLPALTETGHLDVAYRLALADTCPSWGHAVRHGATTIWERWDGWTEERGLQDPAMNSFNHYAFGAVGAWLYGTVTGIAVSGDRSFRLAPRPGPGLDWARGAYRSLWGTVACGWTRDGADLRVEVTVPPNTSARLHLAVAEDQQVTESDRALDLVEGVRGVRRSAAGVEAELGSGSYQLTLPGGAAPACEE